MAQSRRRRSGVWICVPHGVLATRCCVVRWRLAHPSFQQVGICPLWQDSCFPGFLSWLLPGRLAAMVVQLRGSPVSALKPVARGQPDDVEGGGTHEDATQQAAEGIE